MKTVLITGASSGIGAELARQYAAADWRVLACGRNQQALAALEGCEPLRFDVSDRDSVLEVGRQLKLDFDHAAASLDLLLLNAGTCEYMDDAIAFDSALFERVIGTNLLALGYCLEAFMPLLERGSQLALMSSSAVMLAFPRAEAYGASKAGVSYLAESLRLDLAASGIEVSEIRPGFVKTPLTDKNDFAMPMRITPVQAANIIIKALAARRHLIAFPRRFIWLLTLLGWLPRRWLATALGRPSARGGKPV